MIIHASLRPLGTPDLSVRASHVAGADAGELVERVVGYTEDGKPVRGYVFQAGKKHRKYGRSVFSIGISFGVL